MEMNVQKAHTGQVTIRQTHKDLTINMLFQILHILFSHMGVAAAGPKYTMTCKWGYQNAVKHKKILHSVYTIPPTTLAPTVIGQDVFGLVCFC